MELTYFQNCLLSSYNSSCYRVECILYFPLLKNFSNFHKSIRYYYMTLTHNSSTHIQCNLANYCGKKEQNFKSNYIIFDSIFYFSYIQAKTHGFQFS